MDVVNRSDVDSSQNEPSASISPRREWTVDSLQDPNSPVPGPSPDGEGPQEAPVAKPRYALPNIASLLQEFANLEQDMLYRAFNPGNWDALRKLPDAFRDQAVAKARLERMCAARLPMEEPRSRCGGASAQLPSANVQGLFSVFDYSPERFAVPDELATKERLEHEAKVAAFLGVAACLTVLEGVERVLDQVSGRDFIPVKTIHRGKHQDGFIAGRTYPYLAAPDGTMEDLVARLKWMEEAKVLYGPFVTGTEKLSDTPTREMAQEALGRLRSIILQDWDEVDLMVYPNKDELWVLRFVLETVDSEEGLVAYMNVLMGFNELVTKYNLHKVVQYWNVKPGDGCIYFTVRPPWVRPSLLEAFYTLHPGERTYSTSQARQMSQPRNSAT